MRAKVIVSVAVLTMAAASGGAAIGQPTPSPSPTTAAQTPPAGSPAAADLTPAQREALQLLIIKTSQNPVGNITVLPFQNNFNYGVGPYARYQYNLNFQPVFPIVLGPSLTLISRTIAPLVSQPPNATAQACASQGCGWTTGLSDVQEQLYFAPKTKPGQLIWGVGPIVQAPTATPGSLGSGKWAAGPDAVALVMPGNWVIGTLFTQLWSFAGAPNRPAVSTFFVQPFVNYNLKGGWALSTAPGITANWAAAQNKWSVPLGGGVARTFKLDNQLMSLSLLYYAYVARPVNQPQTQLRMVWSLLYPIQRGIDVQELLQQVKSP